MVDIVVVGSLNMDVVVRVSHMPATGETISGSDLESIPGGKEANQATAAAKLDSEVAMIGRMGNDVFGSKIKENLSSVGVNTKHVQIDKEANSGTAIILVDSCGENSIVISPGANVRVCETDIDAAEELILQAKILLLQFEIPLETVKYAAKVANKHNVNVILNPAPALAIPSSLLTMTHFLVLNETEANAISQVEVKDLDSARLVAGKLLNQGLKEVIITLGENGALLATKNGMDYTPARKVKGVDTTAGDAFIGGLALAIVRGMPIKDAVQFAGYAGALAVTKLGAQTSLPSLDENQNSTIQCQV